jgi:glycosyltransferase involved in cell wall biosynthesis
MLGPVEHADLPAYAAASNVLIMPYIDAPVTRAMQPLKLKEYLATMKPVVVRDLPATRDWADCCDLASDSESFVRLVQERSQTGTPPEQIEARHRRLASESWTAKAAQLAELINAD